MLTPISLHIFPPCFGLPSFDPDCIYVQALLGLTSLTRLHHDSATHQAIHIDIQHLTSLRSRAPILQMGPETAFGSKQCAELVRLRVGDMDSHLSRPERARLHAFKAVIEGPLTDAQLYHYFVDSKNYSVVREEIARTLPWISRYSTVTEMQHLARKRLSKYGLSMSHNYNDARVGEMLYSRAKQGYDVLSKVLSNSNYLFGSLPTTLDALLFSQLQMHVVPLPNTTLADMLQHYPNLAEYMFRLKTELKEYLPTTQEPATSSLTFIKDSISSYATATKTWTKSLFTGWSKEDLIKIGQVVGAVGVFVLFVAKKGIVQIQNVDEDELEDVDVDVDEDDTRNGDYESYDEDDELSEETHEEDEESNDDDDDDEPEFEDEDEDYDL